MQSVPAFLIALLLSLQPVSAGELTPKQRIDMILRFSEQARGPIRAKPVRITATDAGGYPLIFTAARKNRLSIVTFSFFVSVNIRDDTDSSIVIESAMHRFTCTDAGADGSVESCQIESAKGNIVNAPIGELTLTTLQAVYEHALEELQGIIFDAPKQPTQRA